MECCDCFGKACGKKCSGCLDRFLNLEPNPNFLIDNHGMFGFILLETFISDYNRDCACLEVLLKHSANPNLKDQYDNTAIHESAKNNSVRCMKLLLDYGGDINIRDNHGNTPLHISIMYNHLDMAEYLISRGASINEKEDCGRTPLRLSIDSVSEKFLELLLDRGADPNIGDNYGVKPYNVAKSKYKKIIEDWEEWNNQLDVKQVE